MSAGEAAPAVVEHVVVCLGAHFKRDELVRGRAGRGLAARDEVGSWPSDSVFDDVGYEEREQHADEPAEDGDVRFMCARTEDEGPGGEDAEGDCAGVDEEPCCGEG